VNKKYNNLPMLISYIDEDEEPVTIDSDMILQKAIRLAIKLSHARGEREVMLRLIVHKLNTCKFIKIN
jgi:hypothetical protein